MNEFKVGLLALTSIMAFVYMSFKVTTNKAGFGETIKYRTIVDDAAGIFPKTSIKAAGINSGTIKKIELMGKKALITFEVLSKVAVTSSTILRIKSVGFLGDKYLDLELGDDGKRLKEMEFVKSFSGGGLEDLTKDASQVLKDVKAITRSLRDSIAPSEKDSPIKALLNNMNAAISNIKEMTQRLKRVMTSREKTMTEMIDNLANMAQSLSNEMDNKNQDSLLFHLKKVGPILDKTQQMMDDFAIIATDMKAGKGTIGKLLRDEEIVDQVSETLAGVQKIVGKMDAIRTELSLFTELDTLGDNASDLALKIYPSPERFYLLGITTSELGPTKEKEITTTINGIETKKTRKEVSKNSYKFNIQIGRILHNWEFRVGLIESFGGLGIDYAYKKWSSKFSLEIFDYRKNLGPNIRLLTQVHLWNVFYGKLGVEDIISKTSEQNFFLGAGLRFTDEDLKGLIGFFL